MAPSGWPPRTAPSPLSRLELLHRAHAHKSMQHNEHQAEEDGDVNCDRPRIGETREQLLRKLERYESAQSVCQTLDFSVEPGRVADDRSLSIAGGGARRCEETSYVEEKGALRSERRKESPPPWGKDHESEIAAAKFAWLSARARVKQDALTGDSVSSLLRRLS